MAPGTGTHVGVLALTATFVAGIVGVTYWWLRNRFLKVARVKSIVIYPVKSIMGLEIPYAHCSIAGLVYGAIKDRSMMLAAGECVVSMREEPSLALIHLSHEDGKLTLTADAMDPLVVDAAADPDAHTKASFTVKVWSNYHKAVEVSPQASAWFNRYLKREDVRFLRVLRDDRNIARGENSSIPVAFQDTSAIHMLSVASLKDFNSKLPEGNVEVTERSFRPSFLIEGCDAYAEDHWSRARLGDAEIAFVMRCPRCVLTTVDPSTGTKAVEPLKTLRTYRVDRSELGKEKYKMYPLFGVCQYVVKEGNVSVGDDIYAVASTRPLL
uniref:Putative mitochondrial amidoxime reducing component 2 n=1 Tax=Ixodes ricinus TaxID=34613 RepID=A0A147BH27_IXORI